MARVALAALCVAVFACVLTFPVRAAEYDVVTGAVCDTAEQATMLATMLESKGDEEAIQAVNEDAKDPNACLIASVALIRGEKIVTVNGKAVVTRVKVIGVFMGARLMPLPPKDFYMIFAAEGRPA